MMELKVHISQQEFLKRNFQVPKLSLDTSTSLLVCYSLLHYTSENPHGEVGPCITTEFFYFSKHMHSFKTACSVRCIYHNKLPIILAGIEANILPTHQKFHSHKSSVHIKILLVIIRT